MVLLPAMWLLFLSRGFATPPADLGVCMLGGNVLYLSLAAGLALHGLNFYWGAQIVRKVRGKWRDGDGVGRNSAEGHYHRSRKEA